MNEENTSNAGKIIEAQAPRPTKVNKKKTSNNEKYVLYADIMGFKERVMRTKHADLKKELKGLRAKLENWFKPFVDNKDTFKVSFFSDSIIIIDENTKDGFNRISKAAAGLMQVSLEYKFPINGVIAKGEFTYEEKKQFFFGRAIVDAYLLQLQVHYYGIVAHHSMEKDINALSNGWEENNKKVKGKNPYVLSPIPLKTGKTSHYHLAYNLINTKRETGKDVKATNDKIISWLEEICGMVSGTPRIYVDNTLQVLKENLSLYMETQKEQGKVEFPLKAFE